MSVISSHSLLSRQILLWPPFKEIENNNCFKIYPARSDLKKSERKPLKHDYFEFLIDRSINAWKEFMLPETGSWHVQKLDIFTEFSNMVITVSILSSTASKNRKRIIKTFNCCPCHLRWNPELYLLLSIYWFRFVLFSCWIACDWNIVAAARERRRKNEGRG